MHSSRTPVGMLAAFSVALAIALIVLLAFGVGERGIYIALRATARWSFLLFWLGYSGGAMATIFGPSFRVLAQRGRDFGLAFASAHLVHIGLVIWLYQIAARPPVTVHTLIFFGVAVFWTYLLALFSFGRFSALLSPRAWWIVRTIGINYIALAFLKDFATNPFQRGLVNFLAYAPFLALAVAGPLLRLAAGAQSLRQSRLAV